LPLLGSPRLLGRLGILNPGLAYAIALIGLTYIPASLYLLLWALEPLLILLLAGIFLDEGVTRRFVVLSATAAGGMALVVWDGSVNGQWPGVVLVLAGVACCAAYTVIARRFVATSDSTAQVVLAQQAYALGFALVVALATGVIGGGVQLSGVSAAALASAVGSGVLYYTAAYWFYLSALRMVPAPLAATSFYLIPVFGLIASFVVLGERLEAGQWVGVGVVVVAISLIIRLPARRSTSSPIAGAADPVTG
jgi:probable blue pigment (indigoidine) exporter